MELREAKEILKEKGFILEGAYKDILHQKFADMRAEREADKKSYEARQRKMAKISKKLNKEIEEFVSDLADEMVSDQVTCKYDKTEWTTIIQVERNKYKVDTMGYGQIDFGKFEYGHWDIKFKTTNLENLDNFLDKVFNYITEEAA